MSAALATCHVSPGTTAALAEPLFKGGCVDADPVAMWAGICFVAVVTVAYFFLNRRAGKH